MRWTWKPTDVYTDIGTASATATVTKAPASALVAVAYADADTDADTQIENIILQKRPDNTKMNIKRHTTLKA
jgi:hypothetical protein